MPPRGHSSSSHSSHSSHSSRSSSSFSRSRSSGSYSSSSFSRGPSSHSSTSYSSRPSYSSKPARQAEPPRRPRVNQPLGYLISAALRPSYHYALRHDYVYYPESWTDSSTGTTYEKGYYDENGKRYDDVAFKKDGRYDNVVCHCPYCEQDAVITLKSDTPARQELSCPHCGGMMEIRSALDEESAAAPSDERSAAKPKKKSRFKWFLILALILFALSIYGRFLDSDTGSDLSGSYGSNTQSVQLLQSAIYLKKTGNNTYTETGTSGSADKKLTYDRETESYYDVDSDCWLWYNTDVTPPVWQYWYEGISSDYGDYGWMEHAEDGWHIERSNGNWVKLPSKYDTGKLWYIE